MINYNPKLNLKKVTYFIIFLIIIGLYFLPQLISLKENSITSHRTLNLEDGSGHDLNGIYVINEQKLNELNDEVYLEIRKRGYMAPIYSQLSSMNQLQNLGQLKVAAKKIADKKKAS